ncbi:MAG: DUF1844 domain-containing protein, partial [Fidelibacterota bacterium]
TKQEQLYIHLVSTFTQSAWIALGKVKNPVTDRTERNLPEASLYIDLLDMIKSKMEGNLSGWEERYLDSSIGNLKLNYVEEVKREEREIQKEGEPEAHGENGEEQEKVGKEAEDQTPAARKGKPTRAGKTEEEAGESKKEKQAGGKSVEDGPQRDTEDPKD